MELLKGYKPSTLDFDAKNMIKKDSEPQIGNVKGRIQSILGLRMLELHPNLDPNLQRNFAAVAAYTVSAQGLAKDDMLQEGYQEAVDENKIGVRTVDKLRKGHCNECIFENGVMYIQTTPEYRTTNMRDAGSKIVDLL